uniref:Uncharacterized protein n=1 Tax=Anopheles minimus TaxID=112268 RepID=A0A182WLY1_9DIPT
MEETEQQDLFPADITFCEHYKPLLVEEIALVEHPVHVHNGKCSVIGILDCTANKLGSLSIPDLPTDMQLPDGACSVELCFNQYCGIIPRGKHVEVTGILKLRNTATEISTNSGCLRSILLSEDVQVLKQKYEEMCPMYKPFIEVDHIRTVGQARELISCNLRMRRLNLLHLIEH